MEILIENKLMEVLCRFVSELPKQCISIFPFHCSFSRLIRSDAPAQEVDKSIDEQECPSSQEPSASSLESEKVECNGAQDSAAFSSGPSSRETEENSYGKTVRHADTDGTEASFSDRGEAGRVGSMAARLLRGVQISSP